MVSWSADVKSILSSSLPGFYDDDNGSSTQVSAAGRDGRSLRWGGMGSAISALLDTVTENGLVASQGVQRRARALARRNTIEPDSLLEAPVPPHSGQNVGDALLSVPGRRKLALSSSLTPGEDSPDTGRAQYLNVRLRHAAIKEPRRVLRTVYKSQDGTGEDRKTRGALELSDAGQLSTPSPPTRVTADGILRPSERPSAPGTPDLLFWRDSAAGGAPLSSGSGEAVTGREEGSSVGGNPDLLGSRSPSQARRAGSDSDEEVANSLEFTWGRPRRIIRAREDSSKSPGVDDGGDPPLQLPPMPGASFQRAPPGGVDRHQLKKALQMVKDAPAAEAEDVVVPVRRVPLLQGLSRGLPGFHEDYAGIQPENGTRSLPVTPANHKKGAGPPLDPARTRDDGTISPTSRGGKRAQGGGKEDPGAAKEGEGSGVVEGGEANGGGGKGKGRRGTVKKNDRGEVVSGGGDAPAKEGGNGKKVSSAEKKSDARSPREAAKAGAAPAGKSRSHATGNVDANVPAGPPETSTMGSPPANGTADATSKQAPAATGRKSTIRGSSSSTAAVTGEAPLNASVTNGAATGGGTRRRAGSTVAPTQQPKPAQGSNLGGGTRTGASSSSAVSTATSSALAVSSGAAAAPSGKASIKAGAGIAAVANDSTKRGSVVSGGGGKSGVAVVVPPLSTARVNEVRVFSAMDGPMSARELSAAPSCALTTLSAATHRDMSGLARRLEDEGHCLNLNHCLLGGRAAMPLLCDFVGATAGLTKLLLRNNALDDRCMQVLADSLQRRGSITHLDLADNTFTCLGAASLAGLLSRNKQRRNEGRLPLTSLVLKGNKGVGDKGVASIAAALTYDRSLSYLDVSNVGMGDRGAIALGALLNESQSLQTLVMSWNQVSAPGAKAVGAAVASNQALTDLDVSWNGFGDGGSSYLAESIGQNNALVRMNLAGNNLQTGACMVLAAGMAKNGTLRELSLDDNPLGHEGVAKLLRMLSQRPRELGPVKLGLQRCSFVKLKNSVLFNAKSPNGRYRLDLGKPIEYQIAVELVKLHHKLGADCWRSATLNGQPFTLTPELRWPERMPQAGSLEVDVFSSSRPPQDCSPMGDEEFSAMASALAGCTLGDTWRLNLVQIMCYDQFFTSRQAGELLGYFEWPSEKLEAAGVMFGRVVDPQRIEVMTAGFKPSEAETFFSRLGVLALYQPRNPTGHYCLNLSNQVHYTIACRLLDEMSEECGTAASSTANAAASSNTASSTRDSSAGGANNNVGQTSTSGGPSSNLELTTCWRNVSLDGEPLLFDSWDAISRYTLPSQGELRLDYVARRRLASMREHGGLVTTDATVEVLLTQIARADLKDHVRWAVSKVADMDDRTRMVAAASRFAFTTGMGRKLVVNPLTAKVEEAAPLRAALKGDGVPEGDPRVAADKALDDKAQDRKMQGEGPQGDKPKVEEGASVQGGGKPQAASKALGGGTVQGGAAAQEDLQKAQSPEKKLKEWQKLRARQQERERAKEREKQEQLRGKDSEAGTPIGPPPGMSLAAATAALMPGAGAPKGSGKGKSGRGSHAGASSRRSSHHSDVAESISAAWQAGHHKPKRVDVAADKPLPRKEVIEFLRHVSSFVYLKCEHLRRLLYHLEHRSERIEAVVMFYARLIDRNMLNSVFRILPDREQVDISVRLGWYNVLNQYDPSRHYLLRLERADEFRVAYLLTMLASQTGQCSWSNLHINGEPKRLLNDAKLWNVLAMGFSSHSDFLGRSDSPVLEFDVELSPLDALHAAATAVQTRWRCHVARRKYAELRWAAQVMQHRWRERVVAVRRMVAAGAVFAEGVKED